MWNYECVLSHPVLGYGISNAPDVSMRKVLRGAMLVSVFPILRVMIAGVLTVVSAGSVWASGRLIPAVVGNDLQNQVKSTASKVIPAVVSIASTVMVRDQAFSDETLPFGLFKEPPARRQYGQGSGVIVSSRRLYHHQQSRRRGRRWMSK